MKNTTIAGILILSLMLSCKKDKHTEPKQSTTDSKQVYNVIQDPDVPEQFLSLWSSFQEKFQQQNHKIKIYGVSSDYQEIKYRAAGETWMYWKQEGLLERSIHARAFGGINRISYDTNEGFKLWRGTNMMLGSCCGEIDGPIPESNKECEINIIFQALKSKFPRKEPVGPYELSPYNRFLLFNQDNNIFLYDHQEKRLHQIQLEASLNVVNRISYFPERSTFYIWNNQNPLGAVRVSGTWDNEHKTYEAKSDPCEVHELWEDFWERSEGDFGPITHWNKDPSFQYLLIRLDSFNGSVGGFENNNSDGGESPFESDSDGRNSGDGFGNDNSGGPGFILYDRKRNKLYKIPLKDLSNVNRITFQSESNSFFLWQDENAVAQIHATSNFSKVTDIILNPSPPEDIASLWSSFMKHHSKKESDIHIYGSSPDGRYLYVEGGQVMIFDRDQKNVETFRYGKRASTNRVTYNRKEKSFVIWNNDERIRSFSVFE